MSTELENLLSATIEHLQGLKEEGKRTVCLSPETLQELRKPGPRTSTAAGAPEVQRVQVTAPVQSFSPVARKALPPEPAKIVEPTRVLGTTPATPIIKPPVCLPTLLTPEQKADEMAKLRKSVLACAKCPHLVAVRKNVVFGVGDVNAKLMFVGEAPGADEDVQGEPFVGAAGQLLTRIINTMGLSRQTVYIANILKCRPDMPEHKFGNRRPTGEEMKTCIPWLEKQIELIQPQVMVALGATAVEGLLGSCSGISRLRGNWQTYRNIPLMPTFHPSYLLRSVGLGDKRKVWEDMLQVMTKLGMPISEKQQNYFLKSA